MGFQPRNRAVAAGSDHLGTGNSIQQDVQGITQKLVIFNDQDPDGHRFRSFARCQFALHSLKDFLGAERFRKDAADAERRQLHPAVVIMETARSNHPELRLLGAQPPD